MGSISGVFQEAFFIRMRDSPTISCSFFSFRKINSGAQFIDGTYSSYILPNVGIFIFSLSKLVLHYLFIFHQQTSSLIFTRYMRNLRVISENASGTVSSQFCTRHYIAILSFSLPCLMTFLHSFWHRFRRDLTNPASILRTLSPLHHHPHLVVFGGDSGGVGPGDPTPSSLSPSSVGRATSSGTSEGKLQVTDGTLGCRIGWLEVKSETGR